MSGAPSGGSPSEPASATSIHSGPVWDESPRRSESTQPTAAAVAPSCSLAERRLWDLFGQVEDLASELSSATLSTAATRLQALADARGEEDGQFRPPLTLSFADDDACEPCASQEEDDQRAAERAASVRPGGVRGIGDDELLDGAGHDRDPSTDDPGHGHEWSGKFFDDHFDGLWAYRGGRPVDYGDAPFSFTAPRDVLGLRRAGTRLQCDYHDRRCGSEVGCMAGQVMQQRELVKLVDASQRERQRNPRRYGDGGSARFRCYRAVIADQIADPLGPGNRVRLPQCVMRRVRQLSPNPVCNESKGCDFGDGCIANGHYTGFRTAEESRAIREGEIGDE